MCKNRASPKIPHLTPEMSNCYESWGAVRLQSGMGVPVDIVLSCVFARDDLSQT